METTFRLLTTGAQPLTFDGSEVGDGLPPRPIPLAELRKLLLQPDTSFETRDAVMRVLVRQAQTEHEPAVLGLIGMLVPGLRKAARALAPWRFDSGSHRSHPDGEAG